MDSFNKFLNMGTGLNAALKQLVEDTAFNVEALAYLQAPKDTGFLADSIYTVTKTKSSYAKGGTKPRYKHNAVKARRKALDTTNLLPEIDRPEDDLTAYVAVGAYYGVFLEFGTRFAPAQPFFFQAVDTAGPYFEHQAGLIEDKLREVANASS